MSEKITEKLLEWAQSIQDIASTELPVFASEIIAYKTWCAYIWVYFGVFVILFGLLLVAVALCCKKEDVDYEYDAVKTTMNTGISIIIIASMFTAWSYTDVKKCDVAPRLILIETITKMCK